VAEPICSVESSTIASKETAMKLLLLSLALTIPSEKPHKNVVLWPDGAPGAKGTEKGDIPHLTVFLPPPDKAIGTAVVVCPGGGYRNVVDTYEGAEPAEWLNQLGVAAFVLHYRVAPRYQHPAPMLDVQRALRTVRSRAKEWHIDPNRIGVWGFSAGGHLASTAATHFDEGKADATDPIDRVSCRPDFAILCYPVITFLPPFAHEGSRNNLLGAKAERSLVEEFSNELRVTPETPPTFLFHTNADAGVVPENSVLFYMALRKAKVPAELHIYEQGKHGVGLGQKDPAVSSWPGRLQDWMKGRGLLSKPE
jgi:acetyl esterase/lipase